MGGTAQDWRIFLLGSTYLGLLLALEWRRKLRKKAAMVYNYNSLAQRLYKMLMCLASPPKVLFNETFCYAHLQLHQRHLVFLDSWLFFWQSHWFNDFCLLRWLEQILTLCSDFVLEHQKMNANGGRSQFAFTFSNSIVLSDHTVEGVVTCQKAPSWHFWVRCNKRVVNKTTKWLK